MNQAHQVSSSTLSNTALVLAGAGAAGNAWQLGLIAGLCESGVDVTMADLIIGTSAGSTVAAQITSGVQPSDIYNAIIAEVHPPQSGGGTQRRGAAPHVSGADYMAWSDRIIEAAEDAADMRRGMGAAALALATTDDPTHWRNVVAARLPSHEWPQQAVLIPAVNAGTGEPVVFHRHSGVELIDAVAASTSAMSPYRIGDDRYLNGGYRRSSNADLASGYRLVLVLDPFSGRSRTPVAWGLDLATQVAELRADGSAVETVFPDAGAGDVFNANALDPSTRPQAARGGYEQGRNLAEHLMTFWGDVTDVPTTR